MVIKTHGTYIPAKMQLGKTLVFSIRQCRLSKPITQSSYVVVLCMGIGAEVGIETRSWFLGGIPLPSNVPLGSTSWTHVVLFCECRVAPLAGPMHAEAGPAVGTETTFRTIACTVVRIFTIVALFRLVTLLWKPGTFLAARVLAVHTNLFAAKAFFTAMAKAVDALANRFVDQVRSTPTVGES